MSSYHNSYFWDGYRLSNVHRVIHWGPPSDLEMYIQETGWARRDGQVSFASFCIIIDMIFHFPSWNQW